MKLIIDIPDEYYKKDNLLHFFGCYSEKLDEVIKNGIPLDKIRADIENHCGLIKENHCRFCSYCNSVMGVREILEIIDKYRK